MIAVKKMMKNIVMKMIKHYRNMKRKIMSRMSVKVKVVPLGCIDQHLNVGVYLSQRSKRGHPKQFSNPAKSIHEMKSFESCSLK